MMLAGALRARGGSESLECVSVAIEPNAQQLAAIADMMVAGRLRSVVSRAFPLADVRAAYEQKPMRGKAVLAIVMRGDSA